MDKKYLAHLYDTREAIEAIFLFTENASFEEYEQNKMLRSAVERKFEIVGEALNRIKRDNPELLESIREHRKIISFRNILIHGYDNIDNRLVWDVIQNDLNNLREDTETQKSSTVRRPATAHLDRRPCQSEEFTVKRPFRQTRIRKNADRGINYWTLIRRSMIYHALFTVYHFQFKTAVSPNADREERGFFYVTPIRLRTKVRSQGRL